MKIDRLTLGALVMVLAAVFGLAVWGERLGLDEDTLEAVRAAAASLGAVLLAGMRALLSKDADSDGVPDVLQGGGK